MSQQPEAIAALLPLQRLINRIVLAAPIGATEQLAADLAVNTAVWVAKNAMPALTPSERQFLAFALDLAADRMASKDGFTDKDDAALARLRQLAKE